MWSTLTPLSPEPSLEPVPTRVFLYTKDGTLCPHCWDLKWPQLAAPLTQALEAKPHPIPSSLPALTHPHPSFFRPILPALSAPPSPFSCSQALHPDSSFLWAPCLPAASPHCYPITTYLDSPPWSPAPILTDQVVKEPVTPAGFTPLCSQPLPPVALTLLGVKLAFLSGITGPHLVPSPCRHLPLHSLLLLLLLGRFSRVRLCATP